MSKKQTLIEKFGGSKGIHEMAFGFHQRLLRDQHLRRYFRYLKIDDFVVLQQEFFEVALGKSISKDKKLMEHLRQSFAVGPEEIPRFITHIIETLGKKGLSSKEKSDVIDRIIVFIEVLRGKPNKPKTSSIKAPSRKTAKNIGQSTSKDNEGGYESSCI